VDDKQGRKHKLLWWLGGVAIVAALLAVGGPFVYIHLIEGPPPVALALPVRGSDAANAATTSSGGNGVAGTWHVGTGSLSGYRVNEALLGQNTTAVGRTSDLSGTITISGTTVTSGSFTVAMATVKRDQSQQNAQFNSARIMDTATSTPTKQKMAQCDHPRRGSSVAAMPPQNWRSSAPAPPRDGSIFNGT
jgi:hypothetical protein